MDRYKVMSANAPKDEIELGRIFTFRANLYGLRIQDCKGGISESTSGVLFQFTQQILASNLHLARLLGFDSALRGSGSSRWWQNRCGNAGGSGLNSRRLAFGIK